MPVPQRVNFLVEQASCLLSENGARCEFEPRLIVAQFKIIKKTGFKSVTPRLRTSEFQRWYKPPDLSVESIPNRKSKILKPPHLSVGSI
jgi:hypothetical protein